MRLFCAPEGISFRTTGVQEQRLVLFSRTNDEHIGTAGAAIKEDLLRRKLSPANRAWDLLSIALSVIAADHWVSRNQSPDGWTREFELDISVAEPQIWALHRDLLERQLRFLTTDIWHVKFSEGGFLPSVSQRPFRPDEHGILLLSGGLDSLIGGIDIASDNVHLFAVSQIVPADAEKQSMFASQIGAGLPHLQLNHCAKVPNQELSISDRARSIIFLAYGVLLATALNKYTEGVKIPLYVCENGFIAINPPLTGARIGSLSTRTANPLFLKMFQELLDATELHVEITTPYQFCTKGEMLVKCHNQDYLRQHAHLATSCGRFRRMGRRHCGRCVPCLIRRAAFHKWGIADRTGYIYSDLSRDDADHARFDDVRSMAMAVAEVRASGLDQWMGASLSSHLLANVDSYKDVVERGLNEVGEFLRSMGVL